MRLLAMSTLMTAVALGQPVYAAFAQTTPNLLVVNKAENSISVVGTAALTEEARIAVGENPHELAVAPDGRKAYVVNAGGNSISVVDLETRTETRRITHPDFSFPHGIAFTPDSRHALVTSERSGTIFLIDAVADEVIRAMDTDQAGTHMTQIDGTGTMAYFSNRESNTISFMDLSNYQIVANVPVGEGAEGFALAPDGGELWVSDRAANTVSVIDVPTRSVVSNFPIGERPNRVAFTPDGSHVVIPVASGDVSVFERATRQQVHQFRSGGSPGGIVSSPDGRYVFIASGSDNTVDVVDTRTWTVTRKIPVGQGPDGIAIH